MKLINAIKNKKFDLKKVKNNSKILSLDYNQIEKFHKSIGNKETPLIKLPELAKSLGIRKLLLKDDSNRFGLNAFKALGASYAMSQQIIKYPQIDTFCTATDGNHGRAVAWMAKKLGRKAIIYMPKGTISNRIKVIEEEGAKVFVINEGYDNAVKIANEYVKLKNNNSGNYSCSLVQDTAWDGYEEIPLDIMKGYLTQTHEITNQTKNENIDLLFIQSGVGSWAASVITYVMNQWENPPLCISVEPHSANCLFESIKTGKRLSVYSKSPTTMAGLNCESVSTIAWNILKNGLTGSLSISDKLSNEGMKVLANPLLGDPTVIAGESGASGLGALIGLCNSNKLNTFKKNITLNKKSTVLLINTEGATDPLNYKKVISQTIDNTM